MTVGDEGRSPEVFPGSYISANAFDLLHEKPLLGRDFLAEDDRPGAPPVVILGHTVWSSRYSRDPAILGRTLRVNSVPATVIGVMAEGFRFPLIDELWQPLALLPGLTTERRDARALRAFGRLAPRVTLERAQSELTTVAARLSQEYPGTNKDLRPIVLPFTGTAGHPMFVALLGAVGFVLLIACANVANLMLARSGRRSREISVRLSLGATRWRITRQLLVECFALAWVAGLLGFALSVAGIHLFSSAVAGINFAYWYHERWTMDGRVFAFFAAVCLGTGIVFGLVPALHLSKPDALKDGSRMTTVGRGYRVFGSMLAVFATIALTMCAVGLYAVTAYSVTERVQEVGVRMALGAEAHQLVWLFVRRGMMPIAIGLAMGLGGALGVGRLVQRMLVQTSATDPVTLVSIAALLAFVSLAACFWPARRATRLDPVVALRYE